MLLKKRNQNKTPQEIVNIDVIVSFIEQTEVPLLFVDVYVGKVDKKRIEVYEGDTPETLSKNFSKNYSTSFIFIIL